MRGFRPFFALIHQKFHNFVDGKGHLLGVLERVVGSFDRDKGNDIIFGKGLCFFKRNHFILCAMENDEIIGKVKEFAFPYIMGPEIIQKSLINFHLAVKSNLDFLAFLRADRSASVR